MSQLLKKGLVTSLLLLAIYLFINNPLLILTRGIGGGKLLWPIAFVYFLLNPTILKQYNGIFCKERSLFLEVIIYTILRSLVADTFTPIRGVCVAFIEIFIIPFFLLEILDRFAPDKRSLINFLLLTGALGAVVSSACIISPTFNWFLKTSVMALPEDSFLLDHDFRGFGLAERLTSDYGTVQGLILILGIYKLKDNKWFIPFIPFVFISALFNARTGAFISLVGVAIVLLTNKNFKFSFLFIIILLLLLPFFNTILEFLNVSEETHAWGLGLFEDVQGVAETRSVDDSILGTLFGRMFILPDTLPQWIFGRGYSFFGKYYELGQSSDVGFINQLAFGGLLYVIPLYYLMVLCYKKLRSNGFASIALVFIITFLIANLKGSYLVDSGGLRLLMLLYFYLLTHHEAESYSIK